MQQISAIDIIIETDSQRYFSTEGLQLTNTEIRLNASLNASCCSPSWLINRNILEDIHLNLHSLVCLIISQYYYHSSADPAVVNQRCSNRNWNKITLLFYESRMCLIIEHLCILSGWITDSDDTVLFVQIFSWLWSHVCSAELSDQLSRVCGHG